MKTGDFTIAYHDNQFCTVHKGHIEYDDLDNDFFLGEFDGSEDEGYLPLIVDLLVEALGGETTSI